MISRVGSLKGRNPPAAAAEVIPLTGLAGWYKYDAGTFQDTPGTIPATSGQAVLTWQDQSGNANHLTKTAGTLAVAADKLTVGGDGKLVFGTPLDLTAWDFFFVGKFNGVGGTALWNNSPGSPSWRYLQLTTDGNKYVWNNTSTTNHAGPVSTFNTKTIYTVAGTTANLYIGVNAGAESSFANAGSEHNLVINIGGKAGQLLVGDMHEIVMYSRRLTAPERAQVLAYLNTRHTVY